MLDNPLFLVIKKNSYFHQKKKDFCGKTLANFDIFVKKNAEKKDFEKNMEGSEHPTLGEIIKKICLFWLWIKKGMNIVSKFYQRSFFYKNITKGLSKFKSSCKAIFSQASYHVLINQCICFQLNE